VIGPAVYLVCKSITAASARSLCPSSFPSRIHKGLFSASNRRAPCPRSRRACAATSRQACWKELCVAAGLSTGFSTPTTWRPEAELPSTYSMYLDLYWLVFISAKKIISKSFHTVVICDLAPSRSAFRARPRDGRSQHVRELAILFLVQLFFLFCIWCSEPHLPLSMTPSMSAAGEDFTTRSASEVILKPVPGSSSLRLSCCSPSASSSIVHACERSDEFDLCCL
jgi:hypothetical protein